MKSFKICFTLFLVLFIFTGCTERNNLSDLSIVEGMGIDYYDDEITVTVQTLNLSKEGSGAEALSGNVTMLTKGNGNNISHAIENATEKLSKKIFFGQNRIIVFGMGMAKDYLDKNIDYLLRSSDSRVNVKICIADGNAEEIMKSTENDALVPAESVASLLSVGEERGFGIDVSVNDLLNLFLDKTSDIYLPVVTADDKSVSVKGIAIYNQERLVSVLDDEETFGFLMLSNKIKNGFLNVTSDTLGRIGVDIIKSKTKTYAKANGNKIVFYAQIKADLMLDAVEYGYLNSLSVSELEDIEHLAEDKISEYCFNAFDKCITNQSDCLRIGENLAMCQPDNYKKLSDEWKTALSDASLEISVDCHLKKINENSKGN